jgi:hypothetical protein
MQGMGIDENVIIFNALDLYLIRMGKIRKITKGMSKEELRKILDLPEETSSRGIDAKKYCGVINWDVDPIKYQKDVRSEWDREIKLS